MAPRRIPELAGVAEVAKILGLKSSQHAHYLTRGPDFPEPIQRLAAGPVWARADVNKWAKSWKRRHRR